MNFGQAIVSGFKRYVDFNGRSSRSEFWWWALFCLIVSVVLSAVAGHDGMMSESPAAIPLKIFHLAVLLPSIAVAVRRLHDTDRSGWWYLLVFAVLVGWIILIIWYCARGTTGDNKFGPDPLTGAAPETSPAGS